MNKKLIKDVFSIFRFVINICCVVSIVTLTTFAYSFFYNQMFTTMPFPMQIIFSIGDIFFVFWLAFRFIKYDFTFWIVDFVEVIYKAKGR